ncbi:MAG: 8-amino-7-oxononanoate synthase [Magnetococcales bacterium]|nr:8-amino-7-oxononanoate synthase [Magnetococcales bacterium]
MSDPLDRYAAAVQQRRHSDQWRALRVEKADQQRLDFTSNDYLNLSRHPLLMERACEWGRRWGSGSGAARLLSGNLAIHEQVEDKLARGKQSEAALLFSSGFQANSSVLSALLDRQILATAPLVFTDRLNHASMHHGLRAAQVRQIRYHHNDMNHLETLLQQHATDPAPRFILSETVFSMDGDRADVAALIELKRRYQAFLYLDEAHATGLFGPAGFGLTSHYPGQVEMVMATCGKALGSFGAWVACSHTLRDYLVNYCPGFIYTTALPPAILGAIDAAIDLLPTLETPRQQLQQRAERLRTILGAAGLDTAASTTQIIPVMVEDANQAVAMARQLEAAGVRVAAIRPPTVPAGSSRLRLSITAAHDDDAIQQLGEAIIDAYRPLPT